MLSSDEAEELKGASIGDEVAHEHLASTDESNQMHELVDRLKLLEDLFYTINNGSTSVSMHSLAHLINGLDEDTQIFFHQIDTVTGWTEEGPLMISWHFYGAAFVAGRYELFSGSPAANVAC